MARSVLRLADQAAGIFPDRCVLSGVGTTRAVRVKATQWAGRRWLLGVPGFATVVGRLPRHGHCSVALPISAAVWKMWRFRDVTAMSALAAGVTFFGIGVATGTPALAALGMLTVVASLTYRTRAHHDYWVTCTLQPANSTIVVEPTHQRFDEAARTLFLRTLR